MSGRLMTGNTPQMAMTSDIPGAQIVLHFAPDDEKLKDTI